MDHNKIILAVAKQALSSLGLQRVGKSRVWYDDHGWWAIVVEFQPSSWGRGSYLNVGLSWMLYEQSHWAFDIGYREEGFQQAMREQQFGRVVNIGGLSAHIGAKQRAHVSAGKAALVGLTHALAAEFGTRGITANCVVPGRIGGERSATAGALPDLPDGSGPLVGRLGEYEDVAHMIVAICHPSAGYITGQAVHLSGGLYMT
jgi:hypothetical protein